MKKFLFLLTLLMTTLLLTSVAFAARCDACGSSNVVNAGSGSWCHWDCSDCGSRTSRNHNPNSYDTGLVPASCSGRCSWCGAAAAWSSHSFTNWVPAGDATCLTDGTENAVCSNEQCSAKTSRPAPGSALGHTYEETVVPPVCEVAGYTRHTCIRCGDSYDDNKVSPLSHTYSPWTHNEDGTHTANCTRHKCYNSLTAPCSSSTITVGGKKTTLCPICGYITASDVAVDLEPGKNISAKALNGDRLPGRLMVLVDAAPLEIPLNIDAFYMFLTSYQFSGKSVEYDGMVKVTIDLNEHPFSMPGSIFSDMPPSKLVASTFMLVRVAEEMIDGKPTEVWDEVPFTLKGGILSFETDKLGTFLLVLNIAGSSVG